jgi:hypothetical protein
MCGHEVDCFGRNKLCRHDEITLILSVLFIDQNYHSAGLNVRNNIYDGADYHVNPHP